MASRKKGKWPILAGDIQAPRIQCQDYTKCNTKSNTMAARGCEIYTCATETPELGIFWTGKQIGCKTCLKTVMNVAVFPSSFFSFFSYAENLDIQNTPKSYE